MSEVTRILTEIEEGGSDFSGRLIPLIYNELRKSAGRKPESGRSGRPLDASALVHEAYLGLVDDGEERSWESLGRFFAAAAEAMRWVLVDRARWRRREWRDGHRAGRELDPVMAASAGSDADLLALDAALIKLAEQDPVKARLVELRFFAGLTGDEAARALGTAPSTADRYWLYARAWLRREMDGAPQRENEGDP